MPNNANITDVKKLAEDLHASKVLNLDVTAKQLLNSAQGVGKVTPGGEVQNNVLAWDHYVVITGKKLGDDRIREMAGIKDTIKGTIGK
jgi:hypothetical protein